MEINDITGEIVSAAMKVHTVLGPGLFESAYQLCMRHELQFRGLRVEHELPLPIIYGDLRIEAGYRVDLIVEDLVIVELKSVAKLLPLHQAQLLAYLKLSRRRVGLLINLQRSSSSSGHQEDGELTARATSVSPVSPVVKGF
jgi:GxxExxY protein